MPIKKSTSYWTVWQEEIETKVNPKVPEDFTITAPGWKFLQVISFLGLYAKQALTIRQVLGRQRKGRNAKGNAETQVGLHTVLNVKVLVGALNQEKAILGAFSISAKSSGTFG